MGKLRRIRLNKRNNILLLKRGPAEEDQANCKEKDCGSTTCTMACKNKTAHEEFYTTSSRWRHDSH